MLRIQLIIVCLLSCMINAGATAEVPAYLGSAACVDCHESATEQWQGSHHAEAWRQPDAGLFLNGFEGEEFTHDGMTATFWREGAVLRVDVVEKDGSEAQYTVHSVGGTDPLLHLILETEPGRLQSFDVAWDVENQSWYHLYPDQDLPPEDGYHWSGSYKNWNGRCAECHATGFEKNYDFQSRSYSSSQVEIGVGCEACHGPGEAHVALQSDVALKQYSVELTQDGFTIDMSQPQAAMEQCAGCHARREAFENGNPLPGTAFADAYSLALLRPGTYHADGQILDEVYVYGSFLQSKMHQRGVTCANCHTAHAADTIAEGNAICTQCHSPAGNPDFPTLTAVQYDSPAHHFHPADGEAAQCVNCHMAEQTYMGIDGRRDHSFRVPRPDMVWTTSAPDACTNCHDDRTSSWAADRVAEWYPDGRWQEPHYGAILSSGRDNPQNAAPALLALAADIEQPNLVRATALWLLGTGADSLSIQEIGAFLEDGDPLVRGGAVSALRQRAPLVSAPYLIKALNDDTRSVRVAAARAILTHTPDRLTPELQSQVGVAYRELGSVIANQFDFAEAHLQLGGYALIARNYPAAMQALSEAVRIDPQNAQAWATLVRTTEAVNGREAARGVLKEGLARNPNDPRLLELARIFRG